MKTLIIITLALLIGGCNTAPTQFEDAEFKVGAAAQADADKRYKENRAAREAAIALVAENDAKEYKANAPARALAKKKWEAKQAANKKARAFAKRVADAEAESTRLWKLRKLRRTEELNEYNRHDLTLNSEADKKRRRMSNGTQYRAPQVIINLN